MTTVNKMDTILGTFNMTHPNNGNKYAVKDDSDKATSFIHARCKQSDKANWVRTAQVEGLKLTEWIVKTLNNNIRG